MLWELLQEYLQQSSLPVCWSSPYHKGSCWCHCAVKGGVNPPGINPAGLVFAGLFFCQVILLVIYWVKLCGWRHGVGVKVALVVRVAPGRDEGRRDALLGGEMSVCPSLIWLGSQHCMVFSHPLCCVSFSQWEGETGDQAKWWEGCFSLFPWGICCQSCFSDLNYCTTLWRADTAMWGKAGQSFTHFEWVCLTHLCCQKSIHPIGASQIRPGPKFCFSKKSPQVSTDVFCGVSKEKKRLLVASRCSPCARWTGFCWVNSKPQWWCFWGLHDHVISNGGRKSSLSSQYSSMKVDMWLAAWRWAPCAVSGLLWGAYSCFATVCAGMSHEQEYSPWSMIQRVHLFPLNVGICILAILALKIYNVPPKYSCNFIKCLN